LEGKLENGNRIYCKWYSEEGAMILEDKNVYSRRQRYLWCFVGMGNINEGQKNTQDVVGGKREKVETVSMENKGKLKSRDG
jgi:hypothetical protein